MPEKDFYALFSENLNYYLRISGKTQSELAESLGVSTSTVSTWCRGEKFPRMSKVNAICEYFHIKRSDLMDNKSERDVAEYCYLDFKTPHIPKNESDDSNTICNSIGANIKKWREARNLTQSDLADLLGISDKTVSSWEINRTEPKMRFIEKISIALKCKTTDIIGINELTEPDADYYNINDETKQIAKEIFDNPDLRMILNMARYISPKRLKALIEFMKCFTDQEPDNNDEGC